MPFDIALGTPGVQGCELRVRAGSQAVSFTFAEGGRDSFADLIVAVDGAAVGRADSAFLFGRSGRLELRFRCGPEPSTLRLELWNSAWNGREEPEECLLRHTAPAPEIVTPFWNALRAVEDRASSPRFREHWAHRFPSRRMAVFTRHVTGSAPPCPVWMGGPGHCFIRYKRPASAAPWIARIFKVCYSRNELVPGAEVAWRREEVARLGGESELAPLAELVGRYWFAQIPADAEHEEGWPNSYRHLVDSTEGLARYLDRGYALSVIGGPYATRHEAEEHLEAAWDSRDD